MQPDNNNSYDFIFNAPPAKKGPNLGGPQKILAIVGLFAVVIVIVIVLFSVVFSGGSGGREKLVSVSAHQIELLRVLDIGIDDISSRDLKQRFQTLSTSVTTDSAEVTSLIAARGFEVTRLELNVQKDSTVDTDLQEALERNDLDPAFESAVSSAATDYLASLESALATASTATERDLLQTAISNVRTIAQ